MNDYARLAFDNDESLEQEDLPVGVFLMVALRTASINSADVGTGAMPWRPATDAIVVGLLFAEGAVKDRTRTRGGLGLIGSR